MGAAISIAVLIAHAAPAGADPAQPTDDRSAVTAVTPSTPAIHVEVVGGDSFLELRADAGHTATVLGYQGEPYLRILADGSTEVNRRSPAVGINASRSGGDPTPDADANAEPEWRPVPSAERAGAGTLVWHDHRTHWMGGDTPPITGPGGLVQEWHVGLVVDGSAVDVAGALRHHGSPSRWWWAAGLLALALVALPGLGVLAGATATVATVLLVTTVVDRWSLPSPARPGYTPLVALGVAALGALAAVAGRRRWWAAPLAGGAGAATVLGAWMLRAATTRRFVPGPVPDRAVGVLVVLAGAVGVLALVRGVLASALGADDEPGTPAGAATTSLRPVAGTARRRER